MHTFIKTTFFGKYLEMTRRNCMCLLIKVNRKSQIHVCFCKLLQSLNIDKINLVFVKPIQVSLSEILFSWISNHQDYHIVERKYILIGFLATFLKQKKIFRYTFVIVLILNINILSFALFFAFIIINSRKHVI